MMLDILIMTYALLMAVLIYQTEKSNVNSIKFILIGLILTPIVGLVVLHFRPRILQE